MKIRDIKALARETLLDRYATLIGAKLLFFMISFVLFLISGVMLLFTMVNFGYYPNWIKGLFPGFAPSKPAAIVGAVLLTAILIFTIIFSIWVEFGYDKLLLRVARGQKCSTADILYGFRKEAHSWKVLWTELLTGLMVIANLLIPALIEAIAVVSGYDPKLASTSNPWTIAIYVVTALTVLWIIYETFAFSFARLIMIDDPETDVMDAIRKSMRIMRGNKFRLFWLISFSFLFWMLLCNIVPIISIWVAPYMEMTIVLFYLSISGDLKENPAYRELVRNELEENVRDTVAAHVEEVKEEIKEQQEKVQQAVQESAEQTIEAIEQTAEEIEHRRQAFEEAAEKAIEEPFDRMTMRKVQFPDMDMSADAPGSEKVEE